MSVQNFATISPKTGAGFWPRAPPQAAHWAAVRSDVCRCGVAPAVCLRLADGWPQALFAAPSSLPFLVSSLSLGFSARPPASSVSGLPPSGQSPVGQSPASRQNRSTCGNVPGLGPARRLGPVLRKCNIIINGGSASARPWSSLRSAQRRADLRLAPPPFVSVQIKAGCASASIR